MIIYFITSIVNVCSLVYKTGFLANSTQVAASVSDDSNVTAMWPRYIPSDRPRGADSANYCIRHTHQSIPGCGVSVYYTSAHQWEWFYDAGYQLIVSVTSG